MEDTPPVAQVRAAAAAFNRCDVDGFLDCFAPGGLRTIVGFDTPMSLSELRDSVVEMQQGFEDLELSAEALFGQGDSVCARWRLRGTHVGEFLGVAGSGHQIDVRTCEVYEFENGLVRQVWTYGDHLELLRQLEPVSLEGVS